MASMLFNIRDWLNAFNWFSFFIGWLFDRILMAIPLPEKLHFRIQLFCYTLLKTLSREEVTCTYFLKTREMNEPQDRFERIVSNLPPSYHRETPRDEFIVYSKEIGKIKPEIIFKPYWHENSDGELYLKGIEIEIKTNNMKYYRFEKDVLDLTNIKNDIQLSLMDDCGQFLSEVMRCNVSKMYKFSGLFSEFNLSALRGAINNRQIILDSKSFTVIGQLDSEIIEIMKRIIAFYY